jgi:hypothetical protein
MGDIMLSTPFLYVMLQHSKHDWDLYAVKQDNRFLCHKEEVNNLYYKQTFGLCLVICQQKQKVQSLDFTLCKIKQIIAT